MLTPSGAARHSGSDGGSAQTPARGLRSLWGDLRESVASIFSREQSDKTNFDNVPETLNMPEALARPSFVPENVQLTIYDDVTPVET